MREFIGSEFEKHRAEVKEKWGKTDAYREYEKKNQKETPEDRQQIHDGLMAIFADFAACMKSGESAGSAAAQELVQHLRDYITAHYYHCNKQILAGLGQMYVADPRFKASIDQNGSGTADFASEAICAYCQTE